MKASKSINLCRNCFEPSDVISITACVHPALTESDKNFCIKNLPGIDILCLFGFEFSLILKRIVFEREVLYPAASSIEFMTSTVVDFPFVPVIPIT